VRARGLNVQQAFSDYLPVRDASASVVGVQPRVTDRAAREDFAEFARNAPHRQTRPTFSSARCHLFPARPPEAQFDNRMQTLAYLYRRHGLGTSVRMAGRMMYWKLTGRPRVIRDGTQVSFYASAEEFLALAREAGLAPVRHWRHHHPDTRNNFLFTKADA
jgi:hypothetical protein